jgi:Hsp70 protein
MPALDGFISSFSVQRAGRVEIIANDQGHRITPSWVAFTDEERLYVFSFFPLLLSTFTSYLPKGQDR